MRKLGDLRLGRATATVVSARRRSATSGSSPAFRRPDPADDRRASRTRPAAIDATWFGRRFIERRLHVGAEIVVSGKVKHFGRQLTLDNPEFQAVGRATTELLHAGRIVPVYRADRRPHRRSASGPPSARRSTRPAYAYPGVPAGRDRRRGGPRADRAGDRGGPLPATRSRAATPRSAGSPSTSCSRSSSGWSRRRRQRGPRRGPGDRASTSAADAAIRDGARRRARPARIGQPVDADRRPGRRDRRDPRRPRPADADAPAAPGRRRLGQDRGRGVRARGDRAGRAPGRPARPDRPARPPAPRDRRRRCSRTLGHRRRRC